MAKGIKYLLVKLQTKRPHNREVFKTTLKKIWQQDSASHFFELGVGLVIAMFDNIKDKEMLLRENP